MKPIGSAALAVCLLVGANATAQTQEKSHTETTTKQTGPGANVKTKTETVVGTVKEYEPGKKIQISGPGDKSYSFDLDEGARVTGSIVVGQPAKVTYHKNADGREKVTVLSEASATSQMAATAPKVHSESTIKQTGPGPDVKIKSETVIGIVKEYEPGKKIKVSGPKDKDYSFDLDENVAFKGAVAVGERVKVTYVKTDSGEKITAVEPYKAHS
jgi:hypothetical protein